MTHTERAERRYGMPAAEMPPLMRRYLAELDAAAGPREQVVVTVVGLACEALGREWGGVAPLAEHAADRHLRGAGAHAVQSAALARFTEGSGALLADWCGQGQQEAWEWARLADVWLRRERAEDTPVVAAPAAVGWLAR